MIISCRGWVLAASLLVLGGKAEAQDRNGLGTSVSSSSSTSSTSSSASTNTATVTTAQNLASPTVVAAASNVPDAQATSTTSEAHNFLLAQWQIPRPDISLNAEATFRYKLDEASANQLGLDGAKFGIILGLTTAKKGQDLSPQNSWAVLQLFRESNASPRWIS